jgi:hypothetical protein
MAIQDEIFQEFFSKLRMTTEISEVIIKNLEEISSNPATVSKETVFGIIKAGLTDDPANKNH